MNRRAAYMYGAILDRRPGRPDRHRAWAWRPRTGTLGLIAPTVDITHTGQEETIDGVRIVFQMTPGHRGAGGDELPLPGPPGAVHGRERHPQPAQPADPARRRWSATRGSGRATSTRRSSCSPPTPTSSFASHHWPTWGTESVTRYLPEQRDLYAYLHDQTLRMLNNGLDRHRDRRGLSQLPAGARRGLARPRLLRVGQPQRQGDLPALPRLVRRQPDARCGSTRRQAAATRYVECIGGRDAVAGQGRGVRRRRRPAVRRRAAQARRVRRPGRRRGQGARWPTSTSSSATARRTPPGATST